MNQLVIQNNKNCRISLPDNPEVLYDLRQQLSFKMVGVEYTQAFKHGWDGITYLLNKNGIFPLGLLSRVIKTLDEKNIKYELIDKRKKLELNQPLDISDSLKSLGKVPRDYQQAVIEAVMKNPKGIIRAATGSGKTLMAALITAQLNKPTIIYVIGIDLLQQFHKLFSDIFKEPIGFVGNGVCDIQRINIASVWTVGKALGIKSKMIEEDEEKEIDLDVINKLNLKKMLQSTEVHIFDECHSITCDTIKDIYKNIDPYYIFGMSGTPYKDDGSDLLINGMLGDQIIDVSASELIKRGVLVQPIIKFVNVPSLPVYSRTYADVYSEYIVENEARNFLILKETKELLKKGYQTLVLFKQIKHGKLLFKLFKEHNLNCEILSGTHSLERREEIKDLLLNKKLDVILASTIYDIGVDIPSLNGLVLAGSGRSSIRSLQRIGRVIRSYKNKNYAAIVDFVDNVRFLKQHSEARYRTYSSEKGFIVRWPKQKYM